MLSDPERRREYDRYGITEDIPNFRSKPDYSGFNRFDFDPFDSFFNGNEHFQFNANQGKLFHKLTITQKYEFSIIN